MKRLLPLLLALCLILPAFAEPTATPQPEPENFFAVRAFTYMDGTPFDASILAGKPILINIWATWCPPCVAEMPHLDKLAGEYADKIAILGLHSEGLTISPEGNVVPNEEANAKALELVREAGYAYTLLNPDSSLFYVMNSESYGLKVEYLPTTWFVDAEGYIRRIITGGRDEAGWREEIESFFTLLESDNAPAGG